MTVEADTLDSQLTPTQLDLQRRARRFVEEILMPLEERAEVSGGNLPAKDVQRIRSEAVAAELHGGLHAREHGGVYLCGAATHPAGSVIAFNGRNAAMSVLEDEPG